MSFGDELKAAARDWVIRDESLIQYSDYECVEVVDIDGYTVHTECGHTERIRICWIDQHGQRHFYEDDVNPMRFLWRLATFKKEGE